MSGVQEETFWVLKRKGAINEEDNGSGERDAIHEGVDRKNT